MTFLDSVFLGIIQGITEFLPVSSSGHLVIFSNLLGKNLEGNLFFNVMLHIGTLIAVFIVYNELILDLIKDFFGLIKNIFNGQIKKCGLNQNQKFIIMLIIGLLPLFLLFLPVPFATDKNFKDMAEIFSGEGYLPVVAFSLFITSALLFVGTLAQRNNTMYKKPFKTEYSFVDAICVGIAQCFAAILPGVSRSGSTLAIAQLRGIDKKTAVDYSFILGIPSIIAAAILEIKDVVEEAQSGVSILQDTNIFIIFAGVITSIFVGIFAIKLFKWMLSKDRMYIFIIYTALAGLSTLIYSFTK